MINIIKRWHYDRMLDLCYIGISQMSFDPCTWKLEVAYATLCIIIRDIYHIYPKQTWCFSVLRFYVKSIAGHLWSFHPSSAPKSKGLPWASSFSWRQLGGKPNSQTQISSNIVLSWCVNPIHITVISHQYHLISWIPHPDVRFLSSTETSHPSTQEALEESQGRLFLRISGRVVLWLRWCPGAPVHSPLGNIWKHHSNLRFMIYIHIYIYVYI